jgi:hypothetical protein
MLQSVVTCNNQTCVSLHKTLTPCTEATSDYCWQVFQAIYLIKGDINKSPSIINKSSTYHWWVLYNCVEYCRSIVWSPGGRPVRRCSGCPGERTELTPAAVRPCNSHPGKLYRSERLYENVVHTLRLTKREFLSRPDAQPFGVIQTYCTVLRTC